MFYVSQPYELVIVERAAPQLRNFGLVVEGKIPWIACQGSSVGGSVQVLTPSHSIFVDRLMWTLSLCAV